MKAFSTLLFSLLLLACVKENRAIEINEDLIFEVAAEFNGPIGFSRTNYNPKDSVIQKEREFLIQTGHFFYDSILQTKVGVVNPFDYMGFPRRVLYFKNRTIDYAFPYDEQERKTTFESFNNHLNHVAEELNLLGPDIEDELKHLIYVAAFLLDVKPIEDEELTEEALGSVLSSERCKEAFELNLERIKNMTQDKRFFIFETVCGSDSFLVFEISKDPDSKKNIIRSYIENEECYYCLII